MRIRTNHDVIWRQYFHINESTPSKIVFNGNEGHLF